MGHDRVIVLSFTAVMILLTGGAGPARAGLVSEWRFGETSSAIAHDNVGGINGTLFGGAAFDPGAGPGPGIYSGAISLSEATDGYVSMGNVYPFTSGSFSVVAWVKTTDAAHGQFAVSLQHTSIAPNGYFLGLNNVGDGLGTVGSHFYAGGGGAGSLDQCGEWPMAPTRRRLQCWDRYQLLRGWHTPGRGPG